MQEVLKLIQNRQSARALFDSKRPIARQDLRQILEAARWSPTAHNMQNFEIIVVDDKKILEALGNIKYARSRPLSRKIISNCPFRKKNCVEKKSGF